MWHPQDYEETAEFPGVWDLAEPRSGSCSSGKPGNVPRTPAAHQVVLELEGGAKAPTTALAQSSQSGGRGRHLTRSSFKCWGGL